MREICNVYVTLLSCRRRASCDFEEWVTVHSQPLSVSPSFTRPQLSCFPSVSLPHFLSQAAENFLLNTRWCAWESLFCWSLSPYAKFLWHSPKQGRSWKENKKNNGHQSHFPKLPLHKHWQNDKILNLRCLQNTTRCVLSVCFGEGPNLSGWECGKFVEVKGESRHIDAQSHPPGAERAPGWLLHSAWRSETWYTRTHRDLKSPHLPAEGAWQRLKKLYIPPSVTGQ